MLNGHCQQELQTKQDKSFSNPHRFMVQCVGPTGFYQKVNESRHNLQVDSARAESAGLRAEVEGLRRSADDSRDTIQLNINRFFYYRVWFYTTARTYVDIQLSCTPGRPRPTAGTSRTCAERSSCSPRRSPTLSAATGKSKMASQSVFHSRHVMDHP